MEKKTIFIIVGVLVALVAAYFLFMKKAPGTDKAALASAWNKEVQKHYGWLVKQDYIAKKAKEQGKSIEAMAMDDAKYLATQAGFVDPNA